MSAVSEVAAAKEPGGPQGPVDGTWLILQRLDDLRRAQDDLRSEVKGLNNKIDATRQELDAKINGLDAKINGLDAKINGFVRWSMTTFIAVLACSAVIISLVLFHK